MTSSDEGRSSSAKEAVTSPSSPATGVATVQSADSSAVVRATAAGDGIRTVTETAATSNGSATAAAAAATESDRKTPKPDEPKRTGGLTHDLINTYKRKTLGLLAQGKEKEAAAVFLSAMEKDGTASDNPLWRLVAWMAAGLIATPLSKRDVLGWHPEVYFDGRD